MQLKAWEETILKIMEDCHRDPRGMDRVLKAWRVKLEQAHSLLSPHQIDEIVRAARSRLIDAG